LALAVSLVVAVQIAALAQAPAGDHLTPGNSRVDVTEGVSAGVPVGALSRKLGSLSGRLTDLHSTPLDGATVVLRNAATGAEARTITQKNGSYRFTGLPAGEYTLVAESKHLGQGALDGIFVSPGTEAHVQTAMDFAFSDPQPARGGLTVHSAPPAVVSSAQANGSLAQTAAAPAQVPRAQVIAVVTNLRAEPLAASPALTPISQATPVSASSPVRASTLVSASSTVNTSDSVRASTPVSASNRASPASPDRLDPVSLATLASLANLVDRRSGIGPPLETAVLEAVVPSQPLQGFALPSRPLTALVREAPPLETAIVLSVLPAATPPTLALAGRPTASPVSVASASIPAPKGLPASSLRAAALVKPLKVGWALDAAKGLALSHGAAQIALTEARLRDLMASHQHIDPVTPVVETTLTAEQIQSLPVVGRKWQNFVLDTPAASIGSAGAATSANGNNPPETTIDGVSTSLAFGSASSSGQDSGKGTADGSSSTGMAMPWASGHGLQVAESAIRQVESAAGSTEAEASRAASGRVNVTTQQGGPGFHGQAFWSDRENAWGARNPFTTWVQETAPATETTVPVFGNGPNGTPESYTPPDHETVWGIGLGSQIRHSKLFWFAALDSYRRNDPGVATVKHPYLVETLSGCTIGPCTETTGFFAQPSDDQMQVLSARLGLPSSNAMTEGLATYSNLLETLGGLLGPAPRTASQWVGFARADWQAAERHRFTFEAIGARWNSPGGGLTRVSEPYGNHSFGDGVASEEFLMARWEAFLTSNLLVVTQASAGRNILATHAETPSIFEQTLLGPSIWGQLPQMVVDSRYGFTIGNPARFGRGSYPDEKLYDLKQSLDWVRGSLLVKAGFELAHNADATSLLRNQTGTYHYANVENFASDALVFQKFGVAGELNPADQHNCDQTGRVWVDSAGELRGLGYLPCYSYYSQEIGPSGWHVSTNDWAGFATAQWKPAKRVVVSAGLRWEREQLPGPIAALNNPGLPLTERTPSLGNNWGPRVSMAMGSGESRWPVLRLGYGMYFSQTSNQVIETTVSQTGSFNGDLSFFMRPTDNLNQGGAPPFPYVLAGAPGSVVKPGAVEFGSQFHNPEIHQAVAAVEERLPWHLQVTASAMLSLGRRLPITVDANIDPAVNPGTITYAVVDGTGAGPIKSSQITVPFYASWPSKTSPTGFGGRLNPDYQQVSEIVSRANSTYEAGMLKVERYGRRGLTFHAHYTYAHAMDWNPDESSQVAGASVFDPADFKQEYGTSNLDIRHSAGIMAIYTAPWKLHGTAGKMANGWMLSGTGDFRSGLPYTMRTAGSLAEEFVPATGAAIVALAPGMNGSGGDNRVYGVGRNTYRYPATWKADIRLGKRIDLGHLRQLELLVESFNLFNHQNVTEIETTGYTIEPGNLSGGLPTLNFLTGLKANTTAFGQPLNINAIDFYRERQIQVGMRMRF